MAYNPQNPNGQATMANSAPVVIASDQSDLPVDVKSLEGFYDAGNSSTTPLGAGGVFTGTAIEITNYSAINVAVYSNVASATNGFQMQFSPDGTNWDHTHSFTLSTAPGGLSYAQAAELRYFRVVYTNGGSAQATFRLTTILKPTNVSPSRYTVEQAVTATQMADVVKSVIYGKTSGGGGGSTYVDVKVTPSGALNTATTLDAGTASIGVLGANSGVDIGDVTINNAAGASAVNIQDGGNSITVDGSVSVSNFPATQAVSGTVTANAGTGNFTVVQSTATSLKTQAEVYQGGVAVSSSAPLAVVQTSSATTGGVTAVTGANVGGSSSIAIVGLPAQVYGWYFYNSNSIAAYVTFYNLVSGTVSSTPFYVLVIPPVGGANVFGIGITHSVGVCITIAQLRPTNGTAMPSPVDYTIFYKS